MKEQGLVQMEDVRSDIAEILNNLNDDLECKPDVKIVRAIKQYTLKVVKRKYKEYGGKD